MSRDDAVSNPALKKNWAPDESALNRLLTWFDQGSDSGGERYLEIRRRLVAYFERKDCLFPDELADDTLNRVARRLQEEGAIEDASPAHYCYIVARFVFMEYLRRPERTHSSIDELSDPDHLAAVASFAQADADAEIAPGIVDALEQCLESLRTEERSLILEYYRGEQRSKIVARRELAERLGLSMNALSIRACRLRARLELCVKKRTSRL
jgi:DNA-directed RNA polymerase specialized sigma24 family protein